MIENAQNNFSTINFQKFTSQLSKLTFGWVEFSSMSSSKISFMSARFSHIRVSSHDYGTFGVSYKSLIFLVLL